MRVTPVDFTVFLVAAVGRCVRELNLEKGAPVGPEHFAMVAVAAMLEINAELFDIKYLSTNEGAKVSEMLRGIGKLKVEGDGLRN